MSRYITLVAVCLSLVACNHDDDAKTSWNAIIKKCAVSELNGNTILYFGPSNNVGPGSVWRSGEDGGFRLRYNLEDMPDPKTFIQLGNSSSCEGTSTTKFGLKASLGLTTSVTPASVELTNDFQKAKNIQAKASSMSWDMVKEGPFENYVKGLPATGGVREDLGKSGRLVLYRALRISGFSATLEFSDSDVASLKGKYSGVLTKAVTGDIGAELSASWSADSKLTLASTGDFYIAGELVPFKAGGFAAASGTIFGQPVDTSAAKSIGLDPKQ